MTTALDGKEQQRREEHDDELNGGIKAFYKFRRRVQARREREKTSDQLNWAPSSTIPTAQRRSKSTI